MYERQKKNPVRPESFENLAERYRREMMDYYRERRPQTESPAVVPEKPALPDDARPLFPESTPEEEIILPEISVPALPEAVIPAPTPTAPEQPDSEENPYEPSSPDPAITEISRTGESSIGFLQVRTATGTQAIPIENAHVTVYREAGAKKLLHQVMMTNRSGETPTVQLPAPPESLSQSPGNPNPFSDYTILVHADGFVPVQNIHVPIFANVRSIQPVNLVPLEEFPENPNAPQVFVGKEPDL